MRVLYFILHLSNQLLSVPLLSGRGTKRRPEGRTGGGVWNGCFLGKVQGEIVPRRVCGRTDGDGLWPRCLLPHGCLAAFLDDDTALAGAAGNSAAACSQLEAESRNFQATVGLLQIRCLGGHQARAFIARGHELRCGMLWSPRFAVERLRRPAQRTTSSKVRVHQLLGTTTSAPARARLCCRACCSTYSAETGRTRSNSLMINRRGARFFAA